MTHVHHPVCARCGEHRYGRRYEFRIGVPKAMTNMMGNPCQNTMIRYEVLGTESAFLCGRCACRHVSVRGPLPLLACLAIEAVLFAGLPFRDVQLPQPVLLILVLVLLALSSYASRETWRALKLICVNWREGWELAWTLVSSVLLVIAHLVGPVMMGFIVGDLDEPGQHSVLDKYPATARGATFAAVVFGGTASLHLLLLATCWLGRRDSLERLAWKHRRNTLRRTWPGLRGFSSVEYKALTLSGTGTDDRP